MPVEQVIQLPVLQRQYATSITNVDYTPFGFRNYNEYHDYLNTLTNINNAIQQSALNSFTYVDDNWTGTWFQ